MVLFILTRGGYEEMRPMISVSTVWVNARVLSDAEVNELRSNGVDLTCFTYELDLNDDDEIQSAIGTIALHHPKERIWVETQVASRLD
jgi:hypothetical protein